MEIIRREQAAKRFDEDCYNPAAKLSFMIESIFNQ